MNWINCRIKTGNRPLEYGRFWFFSDGIFIVSLFELDNANLAVGMEFLGNYYVIFFGIPGFKYEVKPFLSVEEGLKMIGMG